MYSDIYSTHPPARSTLCVSCRNQAPRTSSTCPTCGGLVDIFYDLARATLTPSPNIYEKYQDLLPLRSASSALWLGEGSTPLVHARKLGAALGMPHLFLKLESFNPTRSTKDRMAAVAMAHLGEAGISEFVMASTGNSATAFCRQLAHNVDVVGHIFTSSQKSHRLAWTDAPNIKLHRISGSYDDVTRAAAQFARDSGLYLERGFFNIARREGLKTAYLEAYEQLGEVPDNIFQAVSSGMGLLSALKGAAEYSGTGASSARPPRRSSIPTLFGIQQAGCSPMARAFQQRKSVLTDQDIVTDPSGPAEAILRGDARESYPHVCAAIRSTDGHLISVPHRAIVETRWQALATECLDMCNASATAIAGARCALIGGLIRRDDVVLINVTGADRLPRVLDSRD